LAFAVSKKFGKKSERNFSQEKIKRLFKGVGSKNLFLPKYSILVLQY
jgi:hypothetical protein